MTPEDALTDYLVDYLSADSELMGMLNGEVSAEVYQGTTASPFVKLDRLDANDLHVINLHRVWVDTTHHIRGLFHWRGSGRPDRTEVNEIGARLDALLHDHEEQTASIHVHSFREEPTPSPAITEGGDLWLASGGIYRIRVSAVA